VKPLLTLSKGIDWVSTQLGVFANWMVLLACLVSAGNATLRYLFHAGSTGWLEIQWYMFGAMVLLGAPYTLLVNEHMRVDLLFSIASPRQRLWIDVFGITFFLMPICVLLVFFTWPWFVGSWTINEVSPNAGGLIRWPVKLLLPVGFGWMAMQGLSELIKRVATLRGQLAVEFTYEKPLQ
jgi:TRAP-type mannitol/chloroaromatic compound transport system permease small subunit